MAHLDDLVAEVKDASLCQKLEQAFADMKRHQRFGLVFEQHIPEVTALVGLPLQTGAIVHRRDEPEARTLYKVTELSARRAIIEPIDGAESVVALYAASLQLSNLRDQDVCEHVARQLVDVARHFARCGADTPIDRSGADADAEGQTDMPLLLIEAALNVAIATQAGKGDTQRFPTERPSGN